MKRMLALLTGLLLLLAAACARQTPPQPTTAAQTRPTRAAQTMHALQRSTEVATTAAATAAAPRTAPNTTTAAASAAPTAAVTTAAATQPAHSPLWIKGLDVEQVIAYFEEVALSSEYTADEDDNSLMRWEQEICYCLHGSYSAADADWIDGIFAQLNEVEGFPGARRVEFEMQANMNLYFCSRREFHNRMYSSVPDDYADGATTYSYNGANHIFDATICYWEDMDPAIRKSVMTEEIINSIGFSNDTVERRDSVVYQYGSWTDAPDPVDWLLLRLIYAPEMRAGMHRAEAEAVIRNLYY